MVKMRKIGCVLLALVCCISMAVPAFADSKYSNDVSVSGNSTFNSYLYSIGNEMNSSLDVNIPGKCYAALMGANSTSGTRYVMGHGDSVQMQEYNNTGSSTVYESFGAFCAGNWTYCGFRLKNNNSTSKTFTDVELRTWS